MRPGHSCHLGSAAGGFQGLLDRHTGYLGQGILDTHRRMQSVGSVVVANQIVPCLLRCWQLILDGLADREPARDRPWRHHMASVHPPVRSPCSAGRKRRRECRSRMSCERMDRSCRRNRPAVGEKSAEPIGDRNHRVRRGRSPCHSRCASKPVGFGRKRLRWRGMRSVARRTEHSPVVHRTWRRRLASALGIRRHYHRTHRAGG